MTVSETQNLLSKYSKQTHCTHTPHTHTPHGHYTELSREVAPPPKNSEFDDPGYYSPPHVKKVIKNIPVF